MIAREPLYLTGNEADEFNTRVNYSDCWGRKRQAWARFTEDKETVDLIHIRSDGTLSDLPERVDIRLLIKD